MRGAAEFLEQITGKKLEQEKLQLAVKRSGESIDLFKKILHEKSRKYLPSDVTSEMYEIYLTHNGLGTEFCYDYAQTYLDDFKKAKEFKGSKILWLHVIPHWQKPVNELFDFNEKYQIITCDMNFDHLVDMDPEKPYESMAKRLVYNHWHTGQARVEKAVQMGKTLHADGVICFCQWGCKQTMGLSGLFKENFERANIPVLILDGDGVDRRNSSDEQISTRLNAFLEMLEKRKYGS